MPIERYTPELAQQWNDLVDNSRNATFLFKRSYMDYHADRFADYSLIARDDHGKILAALPANREGDVVVSHRGLTYGGWILPSRRCDALDMLRIWDEMLDFLRKDGAKQLIYKPTPHIYHAVPAEEDIYAIFRSGGRLTTSLISSVVDLRNPLPFDQGTRQRARKVLASDVIFGECDDWDGYWKVLCELLRARYNSQPVHTLSEIKMLREHFPNEIKLFTATLNGEILAGIVLYITPSVIHSQYAAASERGKELSAIHGLYQWFIDHYKGKATWFDFGTSNEDQGRAVNEGLLRQKCSYGGRGVVYNTFTIDL